MGLLRKVARKVVGRVTGRGEGPAPGADAPTYEPQPAEPAPVLQAEALQSLECGAQELKERLDAGETVVIVDVRNLPELQSGVLPAALHIPLPELADRWRELEEADEIVLYCAVGVRSLRAAEFLRDKGLINATSLEGGVGAWRQAGGDLASHG